MNNKFKNVLIGSVLCGTLINLYNPMNNINKKENLVIVGNGFGSYYLQKYIDNNKFNKIIISKNDKVLYTPKLVSSLYKNDVEKIKPYNNIVNDVVTRINYNEKNVETEKNKYVYDKVIFCIGSETNDYGIHGVNEHAFKFKTDEDMYKLKEKLKNPKIKKIIIIGSGAVGIELSTLLKNKEYEVTIIEGLKEILPGFNNKTKQDVEKYLEENKIKLIKENFVKSVDKVKTDKNEFKVVTDKNEFDCDLVIWSGGIKFNGYESTLLYKCLNEKSKIISRGINVKDNFSIDEEGNVHCIGDMVANKGPPTAQNTKNQAKWLSKYLNNNKKNNEMFNVEEKGKILHLGNRMYLESVFYHGFIIHPISDIIEYIMKNMD
jgi:NADH dehydrogenase FAD-containing subunit